MNRRKEARMRDWISLALADEVVGGWRPNLTRIVPAQVAEVLRSRSDCPYSINDMLGPCAEWLKARKRIESKKKVLVSHEAWKDLEAAINDLPKYEPNLFVTGGELADMELAGDYDWAIREAAHRLRDWRVRAASDLSSHFRIANAKLDKLSRKKGGRK